MLIIVVACVVTRELFHCDGSDGRDGVRACSKSLQQGGQKKKGRLDVDRVALGVFRHTCLLHPKYWYEEDDLMCVWFLGHLLFSVSDTLFCVIVVQQCMVFISKPGVGRVLIRVPSRPASQTWTLSLSFFFLLLRLLSAGWWRHPKNPIDDDSATMTKETSKGVCHPESVLILGVYYLVSAKSNETQTLVAVCRWKKIQKDCSWQRSISAKEMERRARKKRVFTMKRNIFCCHYSWENPNRGSCMV